MYQLKAQVKQDVQNVQYSKIWHVDITAIAYLSPVPSFDSVPLVKTF